MKKEVVKERSTEEFKIEETKEETLITAEVPNIPKIDQPRILKIKKAIIIPRPTET